MTPQGGVGDNRELRGALPIFLSDVKVRRDARTGCGKPQIPNLKLQTQDTGAEQG